MLRRYSKTLEEAFVGRFHRRDGLRHIAICRQGSGGDPMSLFYKQNAAARFFVDQTNGKVYEVVGGSAALLCWRIRLGGLGVVGCDII